MAFLLSLKKRVMWLVCSLALPVEKSRDWHCARSSTFQHWHTKGEMRFLQLHDRNAPRIQLQTFKFISLSLFFPPEGKPGMSDVSSLSGISGLSFDSTLLSPLLFFWLVLLLFLSYPIFCVLARSSELLPENSLIFFVRR